MVLVEQFGSLLLLYRLHFMIVIIVIMLFYFDCFCFCFFFLLPSSLIVNLNLEQVSNSLFFFSFCTNVFILHCRNRSAIFSAFGFRSRFAARRPCATLAPKKKIKKISNSEQQRSRPGETRNSPARSLLFERVDLFSCRCVSAPRGPRRGRAARARSRQLSRHQCPTSPALRSATRRQIERSTKEHKINYERKRAK